MELTGKALKDFWIWYLLPQQRKTYKTSSLIGGDNVAKIRFLAMSFAERYGVLVDFFDSVGIKTTITTIVWVVVPKGGLKGEHGNCNSRQEARTAAIEKANKIYNKI
jgi:hypothetical protein